MGAWKQEKIGAEYCGDGAAGSHHGDLRRRIGHRMGERSQNPTQDVEDDVFGVPHRIFDVIAEDPEIEHVAQQMHPAAVEKHAGEQREGGRNGNGRVFRERGMAEHNGRDGTIVKDKRLAWFLGQALLIEKDRHAEGNEDDRDEGESFGWIVVVKGDHDGRS